MEEVWKNYGRVNSSKELALFPKFSSKPFPCFLQHYGRIMEKSRLPKFFQSKIYSAECILGIPVHFAECILGNSSSPECILRNVVFEIICGTKTPSRRPSRFF